MPFTTNMSGVSQIGDRLKIIYDEEFLISAENTLTKGLPSLATFRNSIDGKDWKFTIYSKLTKQTSALTEADEKVSEAMSDSAITITPVEYGNTVTPTNLVDLQSGGMVTVAAVRLAGVNMKESVEYLMILRGEAGTNELIVGQSSEGSLTSSNNMTAEYVKRAANKLKRAGISPPYFASMHSDVLYDLQKETGTQGWTEISRYADPSSVINNEIGSFGGFRFLESPLTTINANAGNGNVDTYHSLFFGTNAFGYAESSVPGGRASGPFDKLGRFVNIGWYGVYEFGLVDTGALWLVTCSSSIGSN